MDVHSREQRSRNMQAIRSKDTKAERILAKELWKNGYRYRKHSKFVFGKPDLILKKWKVAIFVDSEYFHGRDWEINRYRITTNREFWWKKIEGNMARDEKVIHKLEADGWKVLRFWDKDVLKNLATCVNAVEETIRKIKKNGKILRDKINTGN